MNEQIRELYEKAHISTTTQVRRGGWDNDREPFEYKTVTEINFDPNVFAELIVRECIRLCDQVDIVGADECIDNIKEHFGVKK